MKVRVVIADDQRLVREGLVSLLAMHDDIAVVGTAADGEEAVALVAQKQPDVVLMDVRMPRLDGIAATRQLADKAKVIALTTYQDDGAIREALAAGARGYLTKDAGSAELAAAIRAVAAGRTTFDTRIVPGDAGETEHLSPREREILALIVRGARNDEIATRCNIGRATVKSHVHALFAKLGARDRADVVRRALGAGLVD